MNIIQRISKQSHNSQSKHMQVTSALGGKILIRRNWYWCLQRTNKKTSGGETAKEEGRTATPDHSTKTILSPSSVLTKVISMQGNLSSN
eukprot:scaffold3350_cov78-Skeletonema_dohrnii-CCMP3373.AAC.2